MSKPKTIFLLIAIVVCNRTNGQGYFSLIEDVLSSGDNSGIDILEAHDTLFVLIGVNCVGTCKHTSILRIDPDGRITDQINHIDLSPSSEYFCNAGDEIICLLSNKIKTIIGHPYGDGISDTLLLCKSDFNDLSNFHLDTITFSDEFEYSNQGVRLDVNQEDLLFFGQFADAEKITTTDDIEAKAYIKRFLSGSDSIQDVFRFEQYIANNQIVDLQLDGSGIYHFLLLGQDDITAGAPIGDEKDPHWHIISIDSQGNIVNEIHHEELGSPDHDGLNLLRLADGNYVLPSEYRPGYGYELSLGGYRGRIQCINGETGEYVWDYILPYDRMFDLRTYKISDLSLAKNGDVIGCGQVHDTDIDENLHQSGFIFRLSPDGNLKWMRIYKHLDNIIQPGEDDYYAPSYLSKVKELGNGDIAAVGGKYKIYGWTSERNLWVLKVNENGCLPSEECQEEITLDSLINVTEAQEYWPVGTKWTYAYEWQEGLNIHHDYIQYEITDTLRENGELIHLVESSRHEDPLVMRQDHLKISFYNNDLPAYQLNYDFDARNVIHTMEDDCSGEYSDLNLKVDSVGAFTLPDNEYDPDVFYELIRNQYIQGVQPEGEISQVLFGIGNLEGGLPVFTCDEDKARIGRIRCFESDEIKVNFQSPWFDKPACDTIWVEVINQVDEAQEILFNLFPNPASDKLYLGYARPTNVYFEIRNTLGQTVIENELPNSEKYVDISGIEDGLYFISIHPENKRKQMLVQKFLKINR